MGRVPRAEFRGALYHVFSRGNRREQIFLDDEDYGCYLGDLQALSGELGIGVIAYCLMPNHPHLCVQTDGAPLRTLMHRLTTRHAKRFNRKYGLRGHLHEGRYRALLVEERVYLLQLVRYIHRNPVKAGLVGRAGDWAFSSHREYTAPETWVARSRVLSHFGDISAFEMFIHAHPQEDEYGTVFAHARRGFCYVGSVEGAADVKARILGRPTDDSWRWQRYKRDVTGDTARTEEAARLWLASNAPDIDLDAICAATQSEPVRSHRRELAVYLRTTNHSVSCIARVLRRDIASVSRLLMRSLKARVA